MIHLLLLSLITGFVVSAAVTSATAYTHLGIETSFPIGSGNGPLNHLHSVMERVVPP